MIAAADARRYDASVLGTAARHPDPLVRRHAALAMGRIGDAAALTVLLELLHDRDTSVGRDAAFALGLLGNPGAVPTLAEFVANVPAESQTDYHAEAATALVKIAQSDSGARRQIADLVGQVLTREQPRVELSEVTPVVQRLLLESWRLGDAAPVPQLIQMAESRDLAVRRRAIYALMRLRVPAAGAVMMNAVADDDAEVRAHVARTLTRAFAEAAGLEPAAAADRLVRLVDDADPGVRINALRALGTYGEPRYASAAADRTDDPEVNVRVQALTALGVLGGDQARRLLEEAVDDGSFAEQEQALWGLARVDRGRGIARAARWITSDEWRRRHAGTEALAILGGDTATAWLEAMIDDPDERVAAAAYGALARLDSARARQLAPGLLEHPDVVVRTVAANRIGEAPARGDVARLTEAYARALSDRESDARIATVRAIGATADRHLPESYAVDDVFLARFPRADDYLVRRAAEAALPQAAARWGPVYPVETGRTIADYRDIVRRLLLPAARDGRQPVLVIETERGRIEIALFAADAPVTVNALLELADRSYFDGGSWHRVVPNFVIQDGDPRGDGWGGPGFALRDEINPRRYGRGTVGMAHSGPDTAGSQFFVTHAPQPHLDGAYTVIGEVRSGMPVVDRITQGDGIRTVRWR